MKISKKLFKNSEEYAQLNFKLIFVGIFLVDREHKFENLLSFNTKITKFD